MTIGTLTILTLTSGLMLFKLALMGAAVILLIKAMQTASHPGSMDPDMADVALQKAPVALPGTKS